MSADEPLGEVISEPSTATLYAGTEVDCVISNISDTGARLRFGSTGSLPSTFRAALQEEWAVLVGQSCLAEWPKGRGSLQQSAATALDDQIRTCSVDAGKAAHRVD